MVLHNQHCHSEFSMDSTVDLQDYYNECKRLKCDYFITTEHLDYAVTSNNDHWLIDTKKLKAKLKKIKDPNGPIPLLGIEVGYRKEYLNEIHQFIKDNGPYDLINLSIHSNELIEFYYAEGFQKYGIRKMLDSYYQLMQEAVNTFDDFDVLSHIDYGYKTVYNMHSPIKFEDDLEIIKQILTKLIERKKALEINIKVQTFFPDEHLRSLLKLYKSLGGVKLTLSTDAHDLESYYQGFNKYMQIIKEEGFNYLCYYVKRKEYYYDI